MCLRQTELMLETGNISTDAVAKANGHNGLTLTAAVSAARLLRLILASGARSEPQQRRHKRLTPRSGPTTKAQRTRAPRRSLARAAARIRRSAARRCEAS